MTESEHERPDDVKGSGGGEEEETEGLISGMAVLDFDMLCSTVAMQTHGKWSKFPQQNEGEEGVEFGAVLRMWEGELLDCFDDRRLALQSACCPCYRFGKNMRQAGFGPCYIQGLAYFVLVITALSNIMAFIVTRQLYFLYIGVAFAVSVGVYSGFYRSQIRKKFNILGSESSIDDCVYHLICPCCTLSQESRTLEMNNVQDGIWHGRGDTMCIGAYSESGKDLFELSPPLPMSTKFPEHPSEQKRANVNEHSWICEVGQSAPLIPLSR